MQSNIKFHLNHLHVPVSLNTFGLIRHFRLRYASYGLDYHHFLLQRNKIYLRFVWHACNCEYVNVAVWLLAIGIHVAEY